MSSEVGFSFQGDVVNLGSLTHMLTGRVLKALSDGGVDTYAVASAFWLGAKIPVRSSLADTVHAHVSQKKSYQSALAKALSIGWGHSTPVVEMTRTRAGSNALLLVGALSTCVSSFEAAQCLSELMIVFGLSPELLPSVDVLRRLVSYLSPFVYDMGFSKVFQHIRDLAKHAISSSDERQGSYTTDSWFKSVEYSGSASVLAAAIKQLIYTSQNLESHYMILESRGSWLPAFASHILGMSVELMYSNRLIWACGGEKGQITFQLGLHSLDNSSVQLPSEGLTILEDKKSWGNHRPGDYLLEEALQSTLDHWPELDAEMTSSIHVAIRGLCHELLSVLRAAFPAGARGWIKDDVKARNSLENTLRFMQVKPAANQSQGSPSLKRHPVFSKYEGELSCKYALSFLDRETQKELENLCPKHGPECMFCDCLCESVGVTIYGFATLAVALLHCRFNPSELRVRPDKIIYLRESSWKSGFMAIAGTPKTQGHSVRAPKGQEKNADSDSLSSTALLEYLAEVLSRIDNNSLLETQRDDLLGVSNGMYTIYYTCIMSKNCHDEFGRTLRIDGGRPSTGGSFRNKIVDGVIAGSSNPGYELSASRSVDETPSPSGLAAGSFLKPHYRPPKTTSGLKVWLSDNSISVAIRLSSLQSVSLSLCLDESLSNWAVPECGHGLDATYQVQANNELLVGGFHFRSYKKTHLCSVLVIAVKGNKLEQLLACYAVSYRPWPSKYSRTSGEFDNKRKGILQSSACLGCCIRLAKQTDDYLPVVVIGH